MYALIPTEALAGAVEIVVMFTTIIAALASLVFAVRS